MTSRDCVYIRAPVVISLGVEVVFALGNASVSTNIHVQKLQMRYGCEKPEKIGKERKTDFFRWEGLVYGARRHDVITFYE